MPRLTSTGRLGGGAELAKTDKKDDLFKKTENSFNTKLHVENSTKRVSFRFSQTQNKYPTVNIKAYDNE